MQAIEIQGRPHSTVNLPVGDGSLPCQRHDPELWFALEPARVELAKSLCAACPIRDACLTGALAREEAVGVWGGELVVDGVVVAKKRGRGRPRKNAA